MREGRKRRNLCAGAMLVTLWWASAVWAHGTPPDLAFYGDFPAEAVRCERTITQAAARCVSAVVAARSACMNAQLEGAACDTLAVDATVQAARQRAHDAIQSACTDQTAGILQFGTVA